MPPPSYSIWQSKCYYYNRTHWGLICHHIMPLDNLVWKPQLLPWKNPARKEVTLEKEFVMSPERGNQRHWIRNNGKRFHFLLFESCNGLWGNLSGQWLIYKCIHTYACYGYLSYMWDYKSVTYVTSLLKMQQHQFLGTSGTCHTRDTCLYTTRHRALVSYMSVQTTSGKELRNQVHNRSKCFSSQVEKSKVKHFPLKINENSSFSFYHLFIVRKRLRFYHRRRHDTEKATLV